MELLPQDAYTGPPPRFAPGDTVYYRGQPYSIARCLGRAPVVGWAYELDGPAELIQVGEGEISRGPQTQPGPCGVSAGDPATADAIRRATDALRRLLDDFHATTGLEVRMPDELVT